MYEQVCSVLFKGKGSQCCLICDCYFTVDLWKAHRRLLLPIFNNRIIEEYIDVFGEQGNVLVERLKEQVGKPPFDVYEYITSCMLDIVFGKIINYLF